MIEFAGFEKIARLNREVIVTEKLDGTNGQVHVRAADGEPELGFDTPVQYEDQLFFLRAASRSRWVPYISDVDDNYGFGRWVHEHADELAWLGPGAHFGEWWGLGIQRRYGVPDKRWSLFNVGRWIEQGGSIQPGEKQAYVPSCCRVVTIIGRGTGFDVVYKAIDMLKREGSQAAPGFMKPEGVVAFHTQSRSLFKMTIDKDTEHKWEREQKS